LASFLSRGAKRPDLAKRLLVDYSDFSQPELAENLIAEEVSKIFDPKASRKNTPFDCYLAALVKLNKINLVFSFDSLQKARFDVGDLDKVGPCQLIFCKYSQEFAPGWGDPITQQSQWLAG